MASYTTNVKQLYVDIGARTQGVSSNLDQTQIFLLYQYLTIFSSVVPVILMLLGVKTITVSLNTCISYDKCILINVDAIGVETITAYLKYIFYGKYIHVHDKLLVPWGVKTVTVHLKCILDS